MGGRETAPGGQGEAQDPWSEPPPPRRVTFGKLILPTLLLLLVVAVGWWIRREGAYERFVRGLKLQNIECVEYQPYPNSPFVTVQRSTEIQQVVNWLGEGRAYDRRYMATTSADCEMRFIMRDGSVRHLKIGATGPTNNNGQLVPSGVYVPIKGGQWNRGAWSGTMSNVYIQLPRSAQLSLDRVPQTVLAAGVPTPGLGVAIPGSASASNAEIYDLAQAFMAQGQLGQAWRVLQKANALDPNDPTTSQLMSDVSGRIQIRLPLLISEIEKELPQGEAKLSRSQYLQLREKVLNARMMAPPDDEKTGEFRFRLAKARPEPNLKAFRELARIDAPAELRYTITDFAWSPDATLIATCGEDGWVRVWDPGSGRVMYGVAAAKGNKIQFSDDGTRVRVLDRQSDTWWEVGTGQPSDKSKLANDKDHSYTAGYRETETIALDQQGAMVKELRGHAGPLRAVKISPDGDLVASIADDKVLSIWGEGAGSRIEQISPYERFRRLVTLPEPAMFAPDGSIVLLHSGAFDRQLPVPVKAVKVDGRVARMVIAAKSDSLLAEMTDGKLLVVDPVTQRVIEVARPEGAVGRAAISPEGKRIVQGCEDGTVRMIDVGSGKEIGKLSSIPLKPRKWAAVEIGGDGAWVMACSEGFVGLWTSSGEHLLGTEQASGDMAGRLAPDGKRLAIIYRDGNMRLLDIRLSQSSAMRLGAGFARGIVFTADSQRIGAIRADDYPYASDRGFSWRNVSFNAQTRSNDADALCFSPDGQTMAVKARDNSVRLFDVPSGREWRRLSIESTELLDLPMSFSPDGKYLIAGGSLWGVN